MSVQQLTAQPIFGLGTSGCIVSVNGMWCHHTSASGKWSRCTLPPFLLLRGVKTLTYTYLRHKTVLQGGEPRQTTKPPPRAVWSATILWVFSRPHISETEHLRSQQAGSTDKCKRNHSHQSLLSLTKGAGKQGTGPLESKGLTTDPRKPLAAP